MVFLVQKFYQQIYFIDKFFKDIAISNSNAKKFTINIILGKNIKITILKLLYTINVF